MSAQSHDQQIVARLFGNVGNIERRAKYDNQGDLIELDLSNLKLFQILPDIGQLQKIQMLDLSRNQLTQIPANLGQLINLIELDLSSNQLTQIPAELGQLTNLRELTLNRNQLTQVPDWIGQLTNLQRLDLYENQLTQVPAELGQLKKLQRLDLHGNQLTQVPVELGQLPKLQEFFLNDNPGLLTPPLEVVSQGTKAVLNFLHELRKDSIVKYEAKVVIVGQGETGKSSLLRALRHEEFVVGLPTTHGIEVGSLQLSHPTFVDIVMNLNTWDFGGQHIYHATHQFFLTKRSLYLLVWDARAEEGRLDFWMETIRVLAPGAPILLVATHADERAPDLNYERYKAAFPQLAGHFGVSNKYGTGIDELTIAIAKQAAGLRLLIV